MLLNLYNILSILLIMLIMGLFFMASKESKWEEESSSSFECGFTSYFFSRYSFSMHYFMVGLIFLFLDLELCFVMPFFNKEISSFSLNLGMSFFILIMILGLCLEWGFKNLEWKY